MGNSGVSLSVNGVLWIRVGKSGELQNKRLNFETERKNMFIGEYSLSMDDKGRMAVPAKFRAILGSGAVLTRGLDKSLFLYPKEQWEEIAKKLASLPISQANSRAFARLMLAGAWDIEIDKQGRMMVPDYLRKFASITKKVVVAGLYDRLEIWNEEDWQAYKTNAERESSTIAEALGELGV
jgi:MraZ protein